MKFDKNTKILIVGLGLIGGSYAKALSDEGYFVGAIDKKKSSVEYALKNGLIQVGETSVKKDFVKDFDLIVFALYPHDFINWIKEYQSSIKSGALITDVTGVKSFVVENVQKILRSDLEFVGAHPMAGKEVSGRRKRRSENLRRGKLHRDAHEKEYRRKRAGGARSRPRARF